MPTSEPPYPAEFRKQMVDLFHAGRSARELAREFGLSAQSISMWVVSRGRQRQSASEQGCADDRRTGGAVTLPSSGVAAAAGARHPGKDYGPVRRQRRQDVNGIYELVNANQANFPVRRMCRILRVSASGYYGWSNRRPSQRALANAMLLEQIRDIHAESDGTYGMPRVRDELADVVSRKRVARLMRGHGICGISRRRGFVVTVPRDQRQRPAPDLVNRRFAADGPDQL